MPLVEVPTKGIVEFPDEMSVDDIDKAIRETWPDLVKPESGPKDALLAERQAVQSEPEPSTLKEFLSTVSEPFIPLAKPDAPADAGFFRKATTGLVRSALGVVEGIESPATVALAAVSAIPVVGKPLAISTGAGIGTHIAMESGPAFYEAVKRGDVQGAAEAAGNFFAGTLFLGGGIKSTLPAKAPPVATKLAPVTAAEYNKTVGETETFAERPPALPAEPVSTSPEPVLAPLTEAVTKDMAEPKPPVEPVGEGPGAMTPTELAPVKEMTTSDKLRLMDQRREELGLSRQDPVLKYTNEQALEDAKAKLDEDPGWLDTLVGELRDKPRAVYPHEQAALNIRRAELNIELERSLKNWTEAFEADDWTRAADEGLKVDRWREAVDDFDSITGRGGTATEAGRSLQAQKIALTEKFRLARMDMETRQAAGELTPKELETAQKWVVDLNEKINRTQKEFDERVAKLEAEKAELEAQLAAERLGKQADADAKTDKATGTERDISGEGEEIAGAIKKRAPRKPKEGELPDIEDDLAGYIKALARNFADQGLRGLDPITDAIHKIVEPMVPGITKRQIQDAFSDYGISKPATTEPVKVHLSQIRSEAQKTSALQDIIEKQQAPLATGQQRVPPNDATRRLIKEINEAKKKYNIQTNDPARQLKSTLDSIRTRLANAIKDAEFEIATRKKIVRTKNAVPTDAGIEVLRARLKELRDIEAEMFPKEPLTDAQLLKIATKAAERSEMDWNKRLEEASKGNFQTGKPMGKKVTSPELEAIQARRDAAKEAVQELYDLANPKKTAEQIALQRLKTRLANRTAELLDKVARGDYEPKPKRQPLDISRDPAAMRLRAENETAKIDYAKGLHDYRMAKRTRMEKVWSGIKQTGSVFVNIMSSTDLSAPRQMLGFLLTSPSRFVTQPVKSVRLFGMPFKEMFSAAFSEKRAQEIQSRIETRPNAVSGADKIAKIEYTKLDSRNFTKWEDAAHSVLDEWAKLPMATGNLAKTIATALVKGSARVVRGSNRGFITALNSARSGLLDFLLEINFKDRAPADVELRDTGNLVNLTTGRGNLSPMTAKVGATVLWSPNLLASRLKLLFGQPFWQPGSVRTKTIIAKEYARMIMGGYLLSKISGLFDEKKEESKVSSDYGKIVRGDTRIDLWGGYQQVTVYRNRVLTATTTSLKGRESEIGFNRRYGVNGIWHLSADFLRQKLRPDVGIGVNIITRTDFLGRNTDLLTTEGRERVLKSLVPIPLALSDIVGIMKEHGFTEGMIMEALAQFGAGVTRYEEQEKQK